MKYNAGSVLCTLAHFIKISSIEDQLHLQTNHIVFMIQSEDKNRFFKH